MKDWFSRIRARAYCPKCHMRYWGDNASCAGCGRVRDEKTLADVCRIIMSALVWLVIALGAYHYDKIAPTALTFFVCVFAGSAFVWNTIMALIPDDGEHGDGYSGC